MSGATRKGKRLVDTAKSDSYVLITGGSGFVGTNLAHRLLSAGHRVMILDNLSRNGVGRNLDWLREMHGERLMFKSADVRDASSVRDAVRRAREVYHFAAQVAVTTSLDDPITDFEINARGTLNVLEAIRLSPHQPPLFFTSTNKVYGGLEDLEFAERDNRYEPSLEAVHAHGIGEDRPLDFHSPYGCSKGTADQYVRDYARSYGLRTVVFRMSCIYGPHQFGTEDQGWVAHFVIRALNREPITICGDGCQVRDVLFVEDLVDAFLAASEHLEIVSGQAFNIGGGASNAISLRELLGMLGRFDGREPRVEWGDWRTGDQRYYVSDTRRFQALTGWTPAVTPAEGVRKLREWLIAEQIPALVQHAEEKAPRPGAALGVVPRSAAAADIPIASAPITE